MCCDDAVAYLINAGLYELHLAKPKRNKIVDAGGFCVKEASDPPLLVKIRQSNGYIRQILPVQAPLRGSNPFGSGTVFGDHRERPEQVVKKSTVD